LQYVHRIYETVFKGHLSGGHGSCNHLAKRPIYTVAIGERTVMVSLSPNICVTQETLASMKLILKSFSPAGASMQVARQGRSF
jgi:hypothetical protein